jgi:hypothetical protein
MRIRIQNFSSTRIRIQDSDDQKLEKTYSWKKNFFDKNSYLVIPRLAEEAFTPQKRHPAHQNMKFLNFFSIFVGLFALHDLDPDPDPAGPNHCGGSGSEKLKKNDDHLRMEINGDYVREARLHAHFRNKLERDVAASSHLRLLAVRQTRQNACKADRHNLNKAKECSCCCSTA